MEQQEQQALDRLQVPSVGELLDDRYRIRSVIATGGMGVILRAEQLPMERPVAIKLLHPHIAAANPNIVGRFEREVRLAKQLNHPNTIRLYDFGESEKGLVYVAMELLEGMNLKRLIVSEGGLRVDRALDICWQILDGLAEAHAHNFIHRDLKPINVFITKNRRGEDVVKLLDFGIAKSLTDATDLTGPDSICGTPSYVSPEYLMQEQAGKPSDVYAVGLILLEMLTGRKVYHSNDPVQTMMMHLKLEPELPDHLEGTVLAEVIRQATAKEPRARFRDAEAMYAAIGEASKEVCPELAVRRFRPTRRSKRREDSERCGDDTLVARAHDVRAGSPQAGHRPSPLPWKAVGAIAGILALGAACLWVLDPGKPPEIGPPEQGMSQSEVSDTNAESGSMRAPSPRDRASSANLKETSDQGLSTPKDSAGAGSEASSEVEWTFDLDTSPSGARVIVDDEEIGRTPISHGWKPDALPKVVRFELEGYEPVDVALRRSSSPIVIEVLEEEKKRPSRAKRRSKRAQRRSAGREIAEQENEQTEEVTAQNIEEVMDRYLVE